MTDNILQSALKAGCWLTDTGELVTDEIDLTAFVRNLMSSGFIDTTLDEAYRCGQEAVAWMDSSGHPKHLRHIQNSAERRLYGKLQPLYLHPQPTWLAHEAGLETAYPVDHPMAKFIMAIEERAASKARREWVGLTDEEMKQVCYETFSYDPYVIARAIEDKLKEKNT